MNDSDSFTRRRVLAGALGAGLLAVASIGIAGAQDEGATPEASDETTPAAGVGGVEGDEATEAAEAIERASAAIASAQADRDAVAAQIDVQAVDQLLAQATDLRDRAQAAADAGDADEARRLAHAATETAKASGDLVAAQLVSAGLPSQQAPASRILADAHETIQEAIAETAEAADADVDYFLATAQTLYQTAFDRYGSAAYGQAAGTARVAARLARIAEGLAGEDGFGFGAGRGPGGRDGAEGPGRGRRSAPGQDDDDDAQDEPVTVPEPTF
jgi:hypothetical protein